MAQPAALAAEQLCLKLVDGQPFQQSALAVLRRSQNPPLLPAWGGAWSLRQPFVVGKVPELADAPASNGHPASDAQHISKLKKSACVAISQSDEGIGSGMCEADLSLLRHMNFFLRINHHAG